MKISRGRGVKSCPNNKKYHDGIEDMVRRNVQNIWGSCMLSTW